MCINKADELVMFSAKLNSGRSATQKNEDYQSIIRLTKELKQICPEGIHAVQFNTHTRWYDRTGSHKLGDTVFFLASRTTVHERLKPCVVRCFGKRVECSDRPYDPKQFGAPSRATWWLSESNNPTPIFSFKGGEAPIHPYEREGPSVLTLSVVVKNTFIDSFFETSPKSVRRGRSAEPRLLTK